MVVEVRVGGWAIVFVVLKEFLFYLSLEHKSEKQK